MMQEEHGFTMVIIIHGNHNYISLIFLLYPFNTYFNKKFLIDFLKISLGIISNFRKQQIY